MNAIAKVYANLILKGKKTMTDVPENLRGIVEKILNEQNEQTEVN